MPRVWNSQLSEQFWERRPIYVVTRNDNLEDQLAIMQNKHQDRLERKAEAKTNFFQHNANVLAANDGPLYQGLQIADNLELWIQHASWTFCDTCHMLISQRLVSRHTRRPEVKPSKVCKCSSGRYVTPRASAIPDLLKMLSSAEIRTLRPFTIHIGDQSRIQHGYLVKTNVFRLRWSDLSVEEKIAQLPNGECKQRCLAAYRFLMQFEQSAYRHFVDKRERALADHTLLNVYNQTESQGVECSLWPHLYPYKSWCETAITDDNSRKSSKIAFLMKVFSEVADYGLIFELLQFHYDRWIFKTVSGAIASARQRFCSPARSLESKTFSTGYWKWEHRFLLDAVRQFGFPSTFITISPYEWSFGFPPWLEKIRMLSGRGPTELAAFETAHISHVLEQIVRGYLCGSNDKRWTTHLFSYRRIPAYPNVETYFYRFEFQKRGTVHLHLLVWLKNVAEIPYHLIRADIPWCNPEMAWLVHDLQRSDSSSLPVNSNPTQVTTENNKTTLRIHHPPDAVAVNLRGYVSSLLPSLKCRMDYQTTDGRGMLLQYVTSYVTKWQDGYNNDALYSHHVTPFQAAYRHLREMHPLEPEMWLALSSRKMAWSSSRRKKFTVPLSSSANGSLVLQKYCRRPEDMEHLSVTEWLRNVDEQKATPKRYNGGVTLVGTKMVSPFRDEYFFQQLLLHVPHRAIQSLYHRDFDRIPSQIRFFACVASHLHAIWYDDKTLEERFRMEGHRHHYIATLMSHIASLREYYALWQKQVLNETFVPNPSLILPALASHPEQQAVLGTVKSMLAQRDSYYQDIACMEEDYSNDEDVEVEPELAPHLQTTSQRSMHVNWKKFLLLTGKPGTGKSHALILAIEDCIQHDRKVLVATPTGYLATQYRNLFQHDIRADTIHSCFHYPVSSSDRPTINWDIADYDLVVMDELSMVSKEVFDHVITTVNEVPIRPVLLMTGDECQQQPFHTVDKCTIAVESIMQHKPFYQLVQRHNLTFQHRTHDEEYRAFLNHIRHWRPSKTLLDKLQDGRILCPINDPSDDEVLQALLSQPSAMVLTVTRKATNRVNTILMGHIFQGQDPLGIVTCDCELGDIPLYYNMRVMVTQNRDKAHGVVNGTEARIHMVQNKTVFLRLGNGNIVHTYPVTTQSEDGHIKTVYPFMPSYSLTICKAQGQTMTSMVVWFDIARPPAGCAYVALSRVRDLKSLFFLTAMQPYHVVPVTLA